MDQTWLRRLGVATAVVVAAGGAVVGVNAAAETGTAETQEVALTSEQVAALRAVQADDTRMQEAKLYGIEREAQEQARLEEERREKIRLEKEREEAERREAERQETERREAERLEAERREAERLEAERREAAERAARTATRAETGDPRSIARSLAAERGWGDSQFSCLDSLWERESGWDVHATNPSSGAYGIPQALPGDKMAVYGDDWRDNPTTQIKWGLDYIADRYGTPCGAWSAFQSQGWY